MCPSTNANMTPKVLSKYATGQNSLLLETFEDRMRLDWQFQAQKNLIEELSKLFENSDLSNADHSLQNLGLAIKEIQANGRFQQLHRQETKHQNPLYGDYKKYPAAAFILEPGHHIESKAYGIKLLYIAALLKHEGELPDSYADILRTSINKYHQVINYALPRDIGLADFIDSWPATMEKLKKGNLTKIREFSRVIENLILIVTAKKSQKVPRPNITSIKPQRPKIPRSPLGDSSTRSKVSTRISVRQTEGIVEPTEEWHVDIEPDLPADSPLLTNKVIEDTADFETTKSKHWISSQAQLSPSSPTRLTQLEKQHLTESLKQALKSDNKSERAAGVLLFLIYLTGQTEDAVYAFKFGNGGDIAEDGNYQKTILRPDNGYQPEEEVKDKAFLTVADKVTLPLPEYISAILSDNARQANARGLLDYLAVNEESAKQAVKTLLSDIRQNGRWHRIRLDRIPASLGVEMTLNYRDKALTYLTAGRPQQAPPITSYYVSYPTDYVAAAYQYVTAKMTLDDLGDKPELKKFHAEQTGYYLKPSYVEMFVQALKNRISEAFESGNIFQLHNAYTDYSITLLYVATGHRSVTDPFAYQSQLDTENGLVLINDKVVTEDLAWRLVALPPIACTQVENYKIHLDKLASHLLKYPECKELAARVANNHADKQQNLPLFFYLDETNKGEWISVSPGSIKTRIEDIWPLPTGFFRHLTATELLKQSGRADWVDIQLGHHDGIAHPFGPESSRSPMSELSQIAQSLNSALLNIGWEPIKLPSKRAHIKRKFRNQPKTTDLLFGHRKRFEMRAQARGKSAAIVRIAFSDWQSNRQDNSIEESDVQQLLDGITNKANEAGLSINRCLRIFYRLIRQPKYRALLRKLTKYRYMVEPSASPFNEHSIEKYKFAKSVQTRFLHYLNEKGKNSGLPAQAERLAEIAFSAALFGRLCDPSKLQNLPEIVSTSSYQFDGELCLEFPLLDKRDREEREDKDIPISRWIADEVSMNLLLRYWEDYRPGTAANISGPKLNASIKQLGKQLGISAIFTLRRLAKLSQDIALLELPGCLRNMASGTYKTYSMPTAQYVRVKANKCLVEAEPADHNDNMSTIAPSTIHGSAATSQISVLKLRKAFSEIFQRINARRPKADETYSKKNKRILARALKKLLANPEQYTQLSIAAIEYSIHLCENGTIFKPKLKYSTSQYYTETTLRILRHFESQQPAPFVDMTEAEYEEIYLDILAAQTSKDRAYIARRIVDFHLFLEEQYRIEHVEFGGIWAYSNFYSIASGTHANMITEDDYFAYLNATLGSQRLSQLEQLQLSMMLILGYRFGLRFSEARHLLFRNLQYCNGMATVIITNTMHGETKTEAGVRVVNTKQRLTEIECSVIEKLITFLNPLYAEDNLLGLMDDMTGRRNLRNRFKTSEYIHAQLRHGTGDSTVKNHTTRHSWVTNEIDELAILPTNSERQSSDLQNLYPLNDIATKVGHAHISTTFSSYYHNAEGWLKRYYNYPDDCLNDHGRAYLLGFTFDYVRDKRRRLRNKGLADALLAFNANKRNKNIMQSPMVSLISQSKIKPIELTDYRQNTPLTIHDIDTILTYRRNQSANAAQICERIPFDEYQVEAVLENAKHLERSSGLRVYKVEQFEPDDMLVEIDSDPDDTQSDFFREENKQVRQFLVNANDIAIDTLESLNPGLLTWQQTFHSQRNTNHVTQMSELVDLIYIFREIYGSVELLARGKISNKLADFLKSENIAFVNEDIPGAQEKSTYRKHASIEIVLKPTVALKTKRALLRVMFCIALAHQS